MKTPWFNIFGHLKNQNISEAELNVIRALLPVDDPRTKKLLAQVEHASNIERIAVGDSAYRLIVPFINNASLLIDLDNDLVSPSIEAFCNPNHRKMRFTLELLILLYIVLDSF